MTTNPSRTVSVSIERAPADVAAFIAAPENLPKWAAGLGKSIFYREGEWVIETPTGPATIVFAKMNPLNVVDHMVRLSDGTNIYVPVRVLNNGTGAEVIFTLFQYPGMTDELFAKDLAKVEQDLSTLKKLLEAA
jgi:hypothetical protein